MKNDTNYEFAPKTLQLGNKSYKIIRINNEKIAITDGRGELFLYENGRPLIEKWLDWSMYVKYVKDERDEILIQMLEQDTTCFFRCNKFIPEPPTGFIEP